MNTILTILVDSDAQRYPTNFTDIDVTIYRKHFYIDIENQYIKFLTISIFCLFKY